MAIHYRTKGIFLGKTARGEADELFTVYTKDFGRLRILGRAIRKITSKLRGGAELFYFSEIEFIQGKAHKTLTDAILIEKFSKIRKDLWRLRIAYRIAAIMDSLIPREERDGQVWQILSDTFDRLNNWKILSLREVARREENRKSEIIYYYFFWNLVSLLGYQPEISGCSIQGKKINCDIVKILKVILKKDWQILSRLRIEPIHQRLLKSVSEWYNNDIINSHEK